MPTWLVALVTFGMIAGIGYVDFATGVEVRVYPLYFMPVSYAAWWMGRGGALGSALLGTMAWVGFNELAGMRFSAPWIWIVNTCTQATAFVVVGLLIAEVKAALHRERGLGRTDALTGLLNSRAFHEEAAQVIAIGRRYAHPVSIAYIDLDRFKSVNDTRGHRAGDELLARVGRVLATHVRGADVAARLGGDEFVVLMPETGPEQAAPVLERMAGVLDEVLGPYGVSASVGAVSYREPPADPAVLLHAADARMYAAKAAGGHRVDFGAVARG